MHAVACHAIYGAGVLAGRVEKIKKVTEDSVRTVRRTFVPCPALSRNGKREAAKNQAGRRKSHRRAHYRPLWKKSDLKKNDLKVLPMGASRYTTLILATKKSKILLEFLIWSKSRILEGQSNN